MHVSKYIVFITMLAAGNASANARFSTDSAAPSGLTGLVFSEVQIEDISDSDMRRLLFYTERTTRALQALVEGADTRTADEQDKFITRFRESVVRLESAGERSGLSEDQVADFLTQSVFDTFGQNFMQQVSTLAEGMDIRTLLKSVAIMPAPHTAFDGKGGDFMDALDQASQDLDLSVPAGETTSVRTVSISPQQSAGPQPLPGANPEERDIVSRVEVVDGRWEFTILQGDSLSGISSAIYGDPQSYTQIYSANSTVIIDPNVVEVGTRLVLPRP